MCLLCIFNSAYCTGLCIAEVFALTWNDIDFRNKSISVNMNILKKNQNGGTKKRHISGNSTTVWYFGTCKTQTSYRTIPIGDTLLNALKEYKREQEENKRNYGDTYMKHYKKVVINPYNNKQEIKILNAYVEIPIPLDEVDFVFIKKNGVYEGTDSCKYPFKVIHYELDIPCRFHDFRDTHAIKLIESGADIKAVSKRLGHRSIDFTYNIYARVTQKMENETADKFEEICSSLWEENIMNKELKEKNIDERTGIEYPLEGDYYIPNLIIPKQEKVTLNKYGRMRLKYLKDNKKAEYSIMLMDGTLNTHLNEIQEIAEKRVNQIIDHLKKQKVI